MQRAWRTCPCSRRSGLRCRDLSPRKCFTAHMRGGQRDQSAHVDGKRRTGCQGCRLISRETRCRTTPRTRHHEPPLKDCLQPACVVGLHRRTLRLAQRDDGRHNQHRGHQRNPDDDRPPPVGRQPRKGFDRVTREGHGSSAADEEQRIDFARSIHGVQILMDPTRNANGCTAGSAHPVSVEKDFHAAVAVAGRCARGRSRGPSPWASPTPRTSGRRSMHGSVATKSSLG